MISESQTSSVSSNEDRTRISAGNNASLSKNVTPSTSAGIGSNDASSAKRQRDAGYKKVHRDKKTQEQRLLMLKCEELHIYKEKWELIQKVLNARSKFNSCTNCDEWMQSLFEAANHTEGAESEVQRTLKELTSEMEDRDVASLFGDGRKICQRANETHISRHEKVEQRFNEMVISIRVEKLEKKLADLTAENGRLSSHVRGLQDWNYCPRCSYNLNERPSGRNFQAAGQCQDPKAGAKYTTPLPTHGEHSQQMPAAAPHGVPDSQRLAASSSYSVLPNQLQHGTTADVLQQTIADHATYTGPRGTSTFSHNLPGRTPSATMINTTSSTDPFSNATLPQAPWPCQPQAGHASIMSTQQMGYSEQMVATIAPQSGMAMQPPPPVNSFLSHTLNVDDPRAGMGHSTAPTQLMEWNVVPATRNAWQGTQFNTGFVLTNDNAMSTAMDIHDIRKAFGRLAVDSDVPKLTCDKVQEMNNQRYTCPLLEFPCFKDGAICEFSAQGVGLLLVEDDKVIVIKQRFPLCINRVAAGTFVAEFVRAVLVVGPLHIPLIPGDTPVAAVTIGSFRLYAFGTFRQGTTAIILLPTLLGSRFGAFDETLSVYTAIRSIESTRRRLDPDAIIVNYNAVLSDGREVSNYGYERCLQHFQFAPDTVAHPWREPNILAATRLRLKMSDVLEDGLPEQLLATTGFNRRVDGDEEASRIGLKHRPDVNVPPKLLQQCYNLEVGKHAGSFKQLTSDTASILCGDYALPSTLHVDQCFPGSTFFDGFRFQFRFPYR